MTSDPQTITSEYTKRERLADGVVHFLGVVSSFSAVAVLIFLSAMWQDAKTTLSVAVYGLSAAAVFATSAAYHSVRAPALKAILRRFDHAAIFLKIAGTYTPFALVSIGGSYGWWLFSVVWAIAIVGVAFKLAGWRFGSGLSSVLYLGQGWLIIFALDRFRAALEPSELILCAAGGVLYTIGVGFFLASRLTYHNAIWHVFVLSASACFYVAILKAVVLR